MITNKDKLIEKLEEYIKLLVKEITETGTIAYVHGWRSQRIEEGEKLRVEIEEIKDEIKGIKR